MNKSITVTPAQLETAAGKIESLATEYEAQFKLLYQKTGDLAQTWKGEANVSYYNQIMGFEDDFQKMKSHMDSYAAFLRTSAKTYRETEERIAAEAKKLQN